MTGGRWHQATKRGTTGKADQKPKCALGAVPINLEQLGRLRERKYF
jgi:hypothetical protein